MVRQLRLAHHVVTPETAGDPLLLEVALRTGINLKMAGETQQRSRRFRIPVRVVDALSGRLSDAAKELMTVDKLGVNVPGLRRRI
jgi:hypothetical protein